VLSLHGIVAVELRQLIELVRAAAAEIVVAHADEEGDRREILHVVR